MLLKSSLASSYMKSVEVGGMNASDKQTLAYRCGVRRSASMGRFCDDFSAEVSVGGLVPTLRAVLHTVTYAQRPLLQKSQVTSKQIV